LSRTPSANISPLGAGCTDGLQHGRQQRLQVLVAEPAVQLTDLLRAWPSWFRRPRAMAVRSWSRSTPSSDFALFSL
jgi:hypothetical protein